MKKIILATLGLGLLAVGLNANAIGQGGIAGSASMKLRTSTGDGTPQLVSHVSSSIAIGKQSAYTGAAGSNVDKVPATTFATGASGTIVIDRATSYIKSVSIDGYLGNEQKNVMQTGTISLDGAAPLGKFKGDAN